jgi:hypothetical protein
VYALLAQKTMVQLLTVYVWLRIGVTVLTVLASRRMRKTKPGMPRPFRIPWGRAGLFYVVAAPLVMSVVALVGSDPFARKWGPVPVLLALPMYFVIRKFQPAKSTGDLHTT